MATADELAANSDDCAICWDKMESARKLPCGHFFHKYVVMVLSVVRIHKDFVFNGNRLRGFQNNFLSHIALVHA